MSRFVQDRSIRKQKKTVAALQLRAGREKCSEALGACRDREHPEAVETEPQLLHLLAPNEAVVAIGVEIRIGETVGMMNIAMPSIIIKMMRQKFDQQWSVRK